MRSGHDVRMTEAQAQAVDQLRRTLLEDSPLAEVKAWDVAQPSPEEVKGALAETVLVRVELGFPKDEADFRMMLRDRRTYLVSARGRVEAWNGHRAFRMTRKPRTRQRVAARRMTTGTNGAE